jgi:hypothetical protein
MEKANLSAWKKTNKYASIDEYISFCGEIDKLLVNIVHQECVEVELCIRILIGGENRQKSQNGFIYPLI